MCYSVDTPLQGKRTGEEKSASRATKSVHAAAGKLLSNADGPSATEIRKIERATARKEAKEHVNTVKRAARTTPVTAKEAAAAGEEEAGRQDVPRETRLGAARKKAKEQEERPRVKTDHSRTRQRVRAKNGGKGGREKLERAKKRAGTRSTTKRQKGARS